MKIFAIADIHLGYIDPEFQWENLKEHFFSHVEKEKPDMIVVAGDITHERVNVNTVTAHVFNMFIDKLISTGATIVIIEGTKSHDDGQINVFSHRINDKFRIYNKVTSERIMGLDFLFIPEEYMLEPEEYYEPFMKKKYDFVFGHGTFDNAGFVGKIKKTKMKKLTAPLWNYKRDFKPITKYYIGFGHYHIFVEEERFNYISSFGRYKHGEEEKKGFMIYTGDLKKGFKRQFVENKGAKLFITVNESDLPEKRDDLMKVLTELNDRVYKLRISFDRDIDLERKSDIISFVRKHVNTTINNVFDKKSKAKSNSEEYSMDIVENKYENMDIVSATVEFILEKYGVKYDKQQVIDFLNENSKD